MFFLHPFNAGTFATGSDKLMQQPDDDDEKGKIYPVSTDVESIRKDKYAHG